MDAMPDLEHWSLSAMWWHVYPLGFTGAPDPRRRRIRRRSGAPAARLRGVARPRRRARAERPRARPGVRQLRRTATTRSTTSGSIRGSATSDDFDRLVAAAHERGIRVLLDGVFNHVGREHPAFQAALADGPSAGGGAVPIDWATGPATSRDVFEGHDALVALDHASPAVAELVTARHDALARPWRRRLAARRRVRRAARVLGSRAARGARAAPDAWIMRRGHPWRVRRARRGVGDGSVTQYELWQGDLARHRRAQPLRAAARARAAQRAAGDLHALHVPRQPRRDADRDRGRRRPVPHALAVLFTVAGVPAVYAGDEYGAEGVKEERIGGDDAIRPALPETPPSRDDLSDAERATLDLHRELLAIRRRNPWLTRAQTDVIDVDNGTIVCAPRRRMRRSSPRSTSPTTQCACPSQTRRRCSPVAATCRPARSRCPHEAGRSSRADRRASLRHRRDARGARRHEHPRTGAAGAPLWPDA